MKKYITAFLFLVLTCFALYFLSPLFHTGVFNGQDLESHLERTASYSLALRDGQFPVRWAGNLNFGYGTPLFIYIYPLPTYFGAFLHTVGINFQDGLKMMLGVSFILSIVFFYLWAVEIFTPVVALLGALLYGIAPYHFLDLYVRGAVGEMLAFVFLPLVFLAIQKLLSKFSYKWVLIGGLSYAFLILSHNGISFQFSPIIFFYPFFFKRKIFFKEEIAILYMLLLGLLLSAFFWVPALLDMKYLATLSIFENNYASNFPSLIQLIYSHWGFGPMVNLPGGLSPQLGIVQTIILIASLSLLFMKGQKRMLVFWLGIFILSIFLSTSYSKFLYEHISTLRNFQFPWRFVLVASFAIAMLGMYLFQRLHRSIVIISIAIILIYSLQLITVQKYMNYPDSYYFSYTGTSFQHGEGTTRWTAGDAKSASLAPVEVIAGNAQITSMHRKSQVHVYTVTSSGSATILDNTVYFPGWKVYVDNKEVPIQFQDTNHPGFITFPINKGNHSVVAIFSESGLLLLGDIASIFGIAIFLLFLLQYINVSAFRKNV